MQMEDIPDDPHVPFLDINVAIQPLLLVIYDTIDNYEKAVYRHPADEAIIRFSEYLGDLKGMWSVAVSLGILIENPDDLAGELYDKLLLYLTTAKHQQPEDDAQAHNALTLESAIEMSVEEFGSYMTLNYPQAPIVYEQRSTFVMETFYSLYPENIDQEHDPQSELDHIADLPSLQDELQDVA